MKNWLIPLVFLSTSTAGAQETRQHGAHAHGTGNLNIVVEGNELVIELISPAANIVGFEYHPSTDEEKQAVENATAALNDAASLFGLSEAAGCKIEHIDIESTLVEGDHDDEHGHKDDDHDDDHDDEHADEHGHKDDDHNDEHADEEGHKDDEHADEEGHKDDDHDEEHADEHGHKDDHDEDHEGETHSEFHAMYEYHCEQSENLSNIDVLLFDVFPLTETLNVQLLSTRGQSAKTLSKDDHLLEL